LRSIGEVQLSDAFHTLDVSSPARAVMECLHPANDEASQLECGQLMDGLNNLRLDQTQALLEVCASVKVKRMFLYLAELAGHAWVRHVDRSNIDLGSGKRAREGRRPCSGVTVRRELQDSTRP